MNTQQIQYLLEICETKSMSKAAAKLYVSQPNLSNSIHALENELGFPIFKRTKYGMLPTDNGMLVLKHARQIWDSYQKMQQINTGRNRKRFHLGSMFIPPVYRSFERLCLFYQNETTVDFSFVDHVNINFDTLALTDYDIQLYMLPPRDVNSFIARADAKGILVTALKDIPIVLRIGPHHPLYYQTNLSPADFANYIFVDYAGEIYQDYPGLERLIPIDHRRIISVNDRTTKHNLVSKGPFISLGIKLPVDMDEMYGFRSIPLENISYTLILLEWKNQRRSAEVQKYIQFLMEELEMI